MMTQLKAEWRQLALRVDAMTARERAIITAVICVAFGVAFQLGMLDALNKKKRSASEEAMSALEEKQNLAVQVAESKAAQANDPNKALAARLLTAQQGVQKANEELTTVSQHLLEPKAVPDFLRDVVAKHPGIELIRIETLPDVAKVNASGAEVLDTESIDSGLLYRHGLEVEVIGNYEEISSWLHAIAEIPAQVQWDYMDYVVDQRMDNIQLAHPRARLLIRFYTLSIEEVWLRV